MHCVKSRFDGNHVMVLREHMGELEVIRVSTTALPVFCQPRIKLLRGGGVLVPSCPLSLAQLDAEVRLIRLATGRTDQEQDVTLGHIPTYPPRNAVIALGISCARASIP